MDAPLVLRAGAPAIAARIEHTLLRPEATADDVARLCDEAVRLGLLAVCVAPAHVPLCRDRLQDSGVRLVTVVGFPLGSTLTEVKAFEADRVQALGADEVDMVIDVGALRAGDIDAVKRDIAAVVATRRPGNLVKVILETGLLGEDQKVKGALAARDAGADMVKTATGFGPGGATLDDVRLLRRTLGPAVGIKAAGGVRDLAAAERLIEVGADRIGSSCGAAIAEEALRRGLPAPRSPVARPRNPG